MACHRLWSFGAGFFAGFLLIATAALGEAAQDVEHYLVTELHKTYGYPGMVLAGDNLYVTNLDADYNAVVQVYNATGKDWVATLTLEHSATSLAQYGDGVVAVGRRSTPYWTSHISLITPTRAGFTIDHKELGFNTIVESAVSDGERIYFNEKGSRGIFRWNGRGLSRLPVEISGPGNNMVLAGADLFVIELRSLFDPGDESLVRIDTNNGNAERLIWGEQLFGLRNITLVDDLIFGTETYSNEAIVIDPYGDELKGRVALKDGAYGIAAFHKCAVAVMDDKKSLAFIKATTDGVTVVGGWDLNPAGDRLKQPRTLAVNEADNLIFVRSNYICPSCTVTQSSVFAFSDGGEMAARCR